MNLRECLDILDEVMQRPYNLSMYNDIITNGMNSSGDPLDTAVRYFVVASYLIDNCKLNEDLNDVIKDMEDLNVYLNETRYPTFNDPSTTAINLIHVYIDWKQGLLKSYFILQMSSTDFWGIC